MSHTLDLYSRTVIEFISSIPQGYVTTYGTIATAAGNHCGARQVARILHSSSTKYNLPWHRVVNAGGKISPRTSMSHLTQRHLLEEEGIEFDHHGIIDFSRYFWNP